ncbi:MAG TPA: carboxypeptidase regulatory-like domain-containing protein [Terriglobia bacterium]|nr:carboxypeptidase regulatory-like domain-containing protein [Terriglobia bacterium]
MILSPVRTFSQTTISAGSIIGTVTDPSGAVVPGATITITNKATGQSARLISNSTGTYHSGALLPGNYTVRVEATGFNSVMVPVTVQVGVTSSGDVKLQVGSSSTIVQVQGSSVQVNTVQPTIQGVLTRQQIEQLPINGRNFLDLAQLQPGVQIQDGSNFDPTKVGFSSISFGGRFGRTARIEVDGLDESDENVGTTTQNIPMSAIQEFQTEQSSLDLTTELTSSGAVNVTTRSGTNQVHGAAFYYGRWHNAAARIAPTDLFFRRQQEGANVGAPIAKNKLFFFLDWEHTRQDLAQPIQLSDPFTSLSGSLNAPFKESQADGRLDWQIKQNVHAFYRYTYDINSSVKPYIPNTFSPYLNYNHAQDNAAGLDITSARFTHQIRFGFMRFANVITNAVAPGSGIFNPAPSVSLTLGSNFDCIASGADAFCSGPNILAPQATQQHNLQTKYDGSEIYGSHIFRFGFGWNRILGGGYASFFGIAPVANNLFTAQDKAAAANGPFAGGASNPLNYTPDFMFFGNGQGFFTEIPQFGFPGGGQYDNRIQAYFGDTWKVKPNLVLTYGLRYVRDTGRTDSDLPPIALLAQFGSAGLAKSVHQPDLNFAPQAGFAWDPWKSGKTVIRAGAGLYYENAIFNNVLFDRPGRLEQGLFGGQVGASCSGTAPTSIALPDGTNYPLNVCGQPIGLVANQIAAAQFAYQAATTAAGPAANGVYVGNALEDSSGTTGTNLIAPDYRTPFSWQFNAGIERQLHQGTVLRVDYLRNVSLHYLLAYDTNHVGAARYLDQGAAMSAINATNTSFGCPAGTAGIDCAITAGATISDYAGNGLDSGIAFANGGPDCGCAFPGINPHVGTNQMLFPIGRAVYNALQVSLRQNIQQPFRGLRGLSLEASYSLSRFNGMATDQDFITNATDFDNINHYYGPSSLDRTDQFSFGGVGTLPGGFRLSLIVHAYTSLPQTLTIPPGPSIGVNSSQIFISDLTGDGTQGDVLPGTNIGSFDRQVNSGNINKFISAYNNSDAGKLTPAGTALVNAGLFTQAQMQALGAVTPTLAMAPAGQINMGGVFTSDLGITYVFHLNKIYRRFSEEATFEPSVTFFNLTNSANYNDAATPLYTQLNAAGDTTPGAPNSTTYKQNGPNRVLPGSGTFGFGSPRVLEFGAKFTF